jgi:hypothetical protein
MFAWLAEIRLIRQAANCREDALQPALRHRSCSWLTEPLPDTREIGTRLTGEAKAARYFLGSGGGSSLCVSQESTQATISSKGIVPSSSLDRSASSIACDSHASRSLRSASVSLGGSGWAIGLLIGKP